MKEKMLMECKKEILKCLEETHDSEILNYWLCKYSAIVLWYEGN